ncbi:LysR family transcriptional regulator [Roseomonas populi]|uniref:LysR family transcriptional regulator n=1 Tax=Roseomonas populi TaxID=3121582 RepID=A0ABT1XA11_9PROT|nr:LysR family transcriptional regulator [Roseomonas pecuniae]MCR0984938.1 LysR family transcriptional regulator [Roseomonas pecuniae]
MNAIHDGGAVANPRTLDLNLIRVFDALMEERNVNRAGLRLGLTQSAISHALNRLRHHLKDELFVRTRAGMMPTARAMEVSERLREAIRQVEAAFGANGFDPATAQRRFVLAANDMMTATVGARLMQVLADTAPGLDLVIRPSTRIDLAEQIDMGLIDVALGVFSDVPARFHAEVACRVGDVAAVRQGHPAADGLTLPVLAHHSLGVVSLGGPEAGAVGGYILERGLARQSDAFDREALTAALATVGAVPRFRVVTPHSLALPPVIAGTDMVAIVPELLSPLFRRAGLLVLPLPYAGSTTVVQLVWHRRMVTDPGHTWFRALLAGIAAEPTSSGRRAIGGRMQPDAS